MNKLKNIKSEVEYCLKHYPDTRDSDIELFIRIAQVFHCIERNDLVRLTVLFDLPSFESVRRMRQKLQQDHPKEYAPLTEKVARARKLDILEWRATLGYGVEDKSQRSFL